eukprot:COSAG04_NODE_21205_length_378_cov_0.745520_1_plen_68_part_00
MLATPKSAQLATPSKASTDGVGSAPATPLSTPHARQGRAAAGASPARALNFNGDQAVDTNSVCSGSR